MYAPVGLQTDAPPWHSRYVDQVERAPLSVRLTNLLQRIRRVNPWVIDAALGTGFVVVGVISLYAYGTEVGYTQPDAFAVMLTVAASAPYYLRRRFPLQVLVATIIPVVLLAGFEYPTGATPNWLLIGVYTVSAYGKPRERVLGAAAMVLGLTVVAVVGTPDLNGAGTALNFAVFSAAYFFGATVRNRRLYTEQLEERAAALERERDEEAKRAVADERLRIAQELHDVVAHSMGVIAVQAGVGAHVIDQDPVEAKKALENISHTSRSTLAEIRRMLGVLREDEGAQYAPAPGLADLERLVKDIRAAGLVVDVHVDGERDELPPGVDFTAYRIVQEALTNVLKHAGPASVSIDIGYEPSALRLEITDDGRGVNGRSNGGGHGLLGMRERVGVYGGSFQAGPHAGGGFKVAVLLPYGAGE